MENLSSHKRPGVREAIEAAGATLLYLPPYSPDFNPIENAFAKFKALLRKAAERTMSDRGRPSVVSSSTSHRSNAQTCSPPQGMIWNNPNPP
jgi:transposase